MSENLGAFPETSKNDWLAAARKELNGDNPLEKLSFQSGDQAFLPYYDVSDVPRGYEDQRIGSGASWVNAPRIAVADSQSANRAALEHLQEGADGLLLEINNGQVNIKDLLSGIELPFCSVYFYGNLTAGFLERFARYASEKFDPAQVRGAAYGLTGVDLAGLQTTFGALNQFCAFGLSHDKSATDAIALSQLLKALYERFPLTTGTEPRLPSAALLLPLSDDFFGEMIRIHALSKLWSCFREAYDDHSASLRIHAWSRSSDNNALEPHGNMISSVSRAVSAVLAGAGVLTVDPQSQDPLELRTARNVSFILHEESQLARASKLIEGAYFIEAAAQKLAEEALSRFKTLIRK
jgi:methylmalonyl-CoA mutase